MTDAERKALVERMAEAICDADARYGAAPWKAIKDVEAIGPDRQWYRHLARAALSVAEPVVREDEREAASARVLDTAAPAYLDAAQGGWWAEFAPMFAESARGGG